MYTRPVINAIFTLDSRSMCGTDWGLNNRWRMTYVV